MVCIYFLKIFTTVVPYCSTLRLHARYAASVVVIYIFEHLHISTVMSHNKYASLRLHDSNATSPSTSQEYSVMHSVWFFLSTTRGGVKLQRRQRAKKKLRTDLVDMSVLFFLTR